MRWQQLRNECSTRCLGGITLLTKTSFAGRKSKIPYLLGILADKSGRSSYADQDGRPAKEQLQRMLLRLQMHLAFEITRNRTLANPSVALCRAMR